MCQIRVSSSNYIQCHQKHNTCIVLLSTDKVLNRMTNSFFRNSCKTIMEKFTDLRQVALLKVHWLKVVNLDNYFCCDSVLIPSTYFVNSILHDCLSRSYTVWCKQH